MDAYEAWLREVLQLAGEIYFRRVEAELWKFAEALDRWLHKLFSHPRPDWRESFDQLLAQQEAEGRLIEPKSRQDLLDFLEGWSKSVDWSAVAAPESQPAENDRSEHHLQPGAALRYAFVAPDQPPAEQPRSTSGRGDQTQFSREAEEIVSEATGVPRNQGPNRQKIPGSGPGGFRIPDFPVRGPEGSVRQVGAVIEVKASRGTKFGDLSGLSRQQIKDAVEFVRRLRGKAGLVKDPALKAVVENAHVKVFSDLPLPKRGTFARLIKQEILVWEQIPRTSVRGAASRGARSAIPSSTRSIGKPGVGATANIALGIVASLAEAGVAESLYRDAVSVLTDLLQQIAQNGDADEQDWTVIEGKLKEIASMKQSILGYIGEFMSYGQGSLKEQQAMALMSLALDLGEKFGYENKKTWGDVFQGRFGHFEKKR
jgi:hypothetical protein